MRRLLFLILSFSLVLFSSCNRAEQRLGSRTQTLLTEAELLNQSRQFQKARDTIDEAMVLLDELDEKDPERLDYKLMRAKAYMLRFLSKNIQVIEDAEIRPRSLVQLPEMGAYIDYETDIAPARNILSKVLNEKDKLDLSDQAYVHSMLGAIFRLSDRDLSEADSQYQMGIRAYQKQLDEYKAETDKLKPHDIGIKKLENSIRAMQLQRVEVLLLAEQWGEALQLLEENMAGTDLRFFATQFEIVEDHISQIQERIAIADSMRKETRGNKLASALKDRRGAWSKVRDEVGGANPYKAELMQNQIYLADLQNNLIYRIICYHNQRQDSELDEAKKVLETYYPDVNAELDELLH